MAMAGGNCARRLQADETCTALEFVGCAPGSAELLIYNDKVLYFFQYIMQAMGSVIIAVRLCVGITWYVKCCCDIPLREENMDSLRKISKVIKGMFALHLVGLFIAFSVFAACPQYVSYTDGSTWPSTQIITYKNGMGEGYPSSNYTLAANSTAWSNCFSIREPRYQFGWANLGFQQEWNDSVAQKVTPFAFT